MTYRIVLNHNAQNICIRSANPYIERTVFEYYIKPPGIKRDIGMLIFDNFRQNIIYEIFKMIR